MLDAIAYKPGNGDASRTIADEDDPDREYMLAWAESQRRRI